MTTRACHRRTPFASKNSLSSSTTRDRHSALLFSTVALVVSVLVQAPSALGATTVSARDDGEGIRGVDSESGAEVFNIRHLALSPSKQNGDRWATFAAPVVVGDAAYYAVAGDLLRVDLEAGAIVERTFYGASIEELRAPSGGGLDVKLTFEGRGIGAESANEPRTVWFPALKPGESTPSFVPGGGAWGRSAINGLRPTRDLPESMRMLDEDLPKTAAGRRDLDERLAAIATHDRTNPFLFIARALLAKADARVDAAAGYTGDALAVSSTTWVDDFRLCGFLLALEQDVFATQRCELAMKKRADAGIRKDAVFSLVAHAISMRPLVSEMKRALAKTDVARVDRIGELQFASFPAVEGSVYAWAALSDFFASQKDAARAAKWRGRVEAGLGSPLRDVLGQPARDIDVWLLILAGLLFALGGSGIVIGMRSGRRQAAHDEEDGSQSRSGWLPRPQLLEIILVIGALATVVWGTNATNSQLRVIDAYSNTPLSALEDVLDEPRVVSWLSREIAPSAESKVLNAYAEASFAAAKRGETTTLAKPKPGIVLDILRAHATSRSFEPIPEIESDSMPIRQASVLVTLLIFLATVLGGHAIARQFPNLVRAVSYFCPGAAPGISILSVLFVSGLAIACFRQWTTLGRLLQSMAMPDFARYFGTEAAAAEGPIAGSAADLLATPAVNPSWTMSTIAVLLGLHVVFVVVDIVKWRAERRALAER